MVLLPFRIFYIKSYLLDLKEKLTNSAYLSYLKQLFMLVKMVQVSPVTDKRRRRKEEKGEGNIRHPVSYKGPYFPLLFLHISPHPHVCDFLAALICHFLLSE